MPLAEEVEHYYQTSKRSPDTWFEMCKDLIKKKGAKLTRWANADFGGDEAFVIEFQHGQIEYRVTWKVLPTRKTVVAARRQAVTALYHDIKATLVKAQFFGFDKAFRPFAIIDSKRTVSDLTPQEIETAMPKLLSAPKE